MTPEEVEVLIRRIPELQPPPGLEARILRRRATRRFPAATALAASVMFCLGVLWIAHLPPKDRASVAGQEDDPIRLRIEHKGDCGSPCLNEQHWKTTELPRLNHAGLSERRVVLEASSTAPWGAVRRVMEDCTKAGYPRIEWLTPDVKVLKVWLPEAPAAKAPERVILEEIRIRMTREPDRGETIYRISNRKESPTLEDLFHIVFMMVNDYKKAGKTEAPVYIDAAPDVPWREVIRIWEICVKEELDPRIPRKGPIARVEEPVPAGAGPGRQSAETMLADTRRELDARRLGDAAKIVSEMAAKYPESSSTVRAYTRVTARLDEPDDALRHYRERWLVLAPAVYDALLKPLNIVTAQGVLDAAALSKAPDSLEIYLEQGTVFRELGKSGKKYHFDNASTVFSNVARVVQSDSEPWWTAKYQILATLVDRGGDNDVKLANVGLTNMERNTPSWDDNKYGMKDRFLKLKQRIAASK